MYKNKTTIGVITARGGSKGIPRKNIKELGGKPLIAWTIEAAKVSKYLDYFLVSTDDEEIARVSREYGALVPFMRPPELSNDSAKSVPVMQHALQWLEEHEGKKFDHAMILQPTSPFRTGVDIDASIAKIVDSGADSVMSMVKLVDFSLPKLKALDGDRIVSWLEVELRRLSDGAEPRTSPIDIGLGAREGKQSAPRSELADVYKRNCAIYLTRTDVLMQGDMFGKDSRAYVMPAQRSLDINTPLDFLIAETLCQSMRVVSSSATKGQKCVLMRNEEIKKILGSVSTQGKRLLEPLRSFALANKFPVNILEDNAVTNDAEIHNHEGDLWLCLEGEATFRYGGEMVDPWISKTPDGTENPREIKAKTIRGATENVLHPGDWLWIPAGEAHQHLASGTARLVIIKIPRTA